MISIVTPAFNESRNLPLLYERICATMESLGLDWEWIVVDDHSSDDTFAVINRLAERDRRVRGVRFARNFGAHTAVTCGLHQARGDCVAALAADLQAGVKVVWAARGAREGEKTSTLGFSRLYYWVMRSIVGIKEMPATGADFFLMDRAVVDAFSRFSESNSSILALITWMGFRQATISYDKGARVHGRSAWTLKKKLKLVVDSVTAFSYVPIRFMSYVGFTVAFAGFLYAGLVILNYLRGAPIEGWSSLIVVVLVLGGIQMVMMGVLGEYLWRALDESRRRPRYIIEATTSDGSAMHAAPAAWSA
jgi:polyisoprenyl-phosphate glycosyltransferase